MPKSAPRERVDLGWARWQERLDRDSKTPEREALEHFAAQTNGAALLERIFLGSDFLTECCLTESQVLAAFATHGPETLLSEVVTDLKTILAKEVPRETLARTLRVARRRGTFAIALADLTASWSVERVLEELSDLADAIISAAVSGLLREAAAAGIVELADPEKPEKDCGYFALGMGKLGARELNYSSDIDLIVIFDPDKARYRHSRGPQEGFVRLTRSLAQLLQDATADGFAYRTDLRLRPDPGAMPLAIPYISALTYYESAGQNWERAAMIKARPVGGDIMLGQAFLLELRPFIWRRHLDFYAIQDIHSIKRQIQSHRGGEKIAVAGHNIKLGRGGIREIEFYAQTQQLIWGGRNLELRQQRTLDALEALVTAGHVEPDAAKELRESYLFLRRVENALQMQDDRQVHSLAGSDRELTRFALFLGYQDSADFERDIRQALGRVETHYAKLFEEAPDLSGPGNLVFTGGEPEPGTLETLEKLGFGDGARVFDLVRSWHHGRYRATRTTRSRQILTELMPTLLETFGRTIQPDQALLRFDQFISGLPEGVQLFAMLHANPRLLDLLGEIMGGAPLLAEHLGFRPGLLDSVLSPDFHESLPPCVALEAELKRQLSDARDFQDVLDLTRRWSHDRRFQVGVQILHADLDVNATGRALSDIAEAVLRGLLGPVTREFEDRHGKISGSRFAILAFGKLGGGEMTVSSDLDLVMLYDAPQKGSSGGSSAGNSDGPRPLDPTTYFARLAQRFINALTAPTAEGELYEVDMRLRPSGTAGPIATALPGFLDYYRGKAWTWELMALTRARPVAGDPDFCAEVTAAIRRELCHERDVEKLRQDVLSMRQRIAKEKPAKSIWSVKFLRGGLTDLEFIAQYLQLRHARARPEVLSAKTEEAYALLSEAGILPPEEAAELADTVAFLRQVQGTLRLTVGPAFDADTLPDALQGVLARTTYHESFAALREDLTAKTAAAHKLFRKILEDPDG